MTARHDLPDELLGKPFAVRDALTLGLPERRLDALDLTRPFHGVRAPADQTLDLEGRCRALATRFRPGDAFDGITAAGLWGAPLPSRLRRMSSLHVSSVEPRRALRRRGVLGTQRLGGQLCLRRGLPLLSPGDAWITLASDIAPHDLVAVADFLVTGDNGRSPLLSLDELAEVVVRRAGSPGVARARQALPLVRVGAWSRPETLVRLLLARAGLPEPELNVELTTRDRGVLIPDISYPEFRVAVEYNGIHHDDASEKVKDLRRMDEYTEIGWSAVNVDRAELFGSPSSVIARTVRRLHERGWEGGTTIDLTKSPSLEP
jgi:hypothetical protein